jgi:hypothetical protein
MGPKKLVFSVLIAAFALSLSIPLFAETKQELRDQLTKARHEFFVERDSLHDQNRVLRVQWHKERAELYKQLQANPGDKAIQEKLNEGPKKFYVDRIAVDKKLEELRLNWLNKKAELGAKIKSAQ